MQNTQSNTNMASRTEILSKLMGNMNLKEPVFTMPISVKPKTREPASFTDNRIYVSNIPFSFREQDLASMFFKYGRVLSVEIVTNDRGSKGFGFVTLDSIESCEKARAALHESHVQGRIIEVRRATPTRRKLINNPQNELLPPPKLCVDLRAPHNQWRTEPTIHFHADTENLSRFPAAGFMMAPYNGGNRFPPSSGRQPFGEICNVPLRCMKHSELKLSSSGEYFCKNGEPTTENSLLMCLNGQACSNKGCDSSNHELSDVELNSVFPNHLRDQITALLDTSNHYGSSNTSANQRRAPSVSSSGSGVRSSESETASDEEVQWTPNTSPDILASLYEGSTSFHGKNSPRRVPSTH
uniref:RRM domain-containing protein n=1 Tax=Caenorhabditis tropicalis TaxID=1561998 RepID=A0A1I7TFL4_9PELO